jgi:hypothetical protein
MLRTQLCKGLLQCLMSPSTSLLGCRAGIFFGFVGGLMSKIDMSWIPAGIWNEDMRARTPCCLLRSDNGPSKDDSSEDSGLSESGGTGVAMAPQILTDQLTLSQPGRQIYPPQYYCPPAPDYQTLLRPWDYKTEERSSINPTIPAAVVAAAAATTSTTTTTARKDPF